MTGDEARDRFAGARVARLATVSADGLPHLVPVVFAVTDAGEGRGDTVVWAVDHKPKRSPARLRRLANIRDRPEVALLADVYDEDWRRLWWVRADGTARVLPPRDASPRSAAYAELISAKYRAQYADAGPPAGPVVEITVRGWSGWRAS